MRTLAAPVLGLGVGALLSFGQAHLVGEFRPLLESAAVFLLVPFVLGVLMRTRRGAGAAGLACALAQLGAWATADALRGASLGPGLTLSLVACAVIGGPLLGASGQLARRGRSVVRGLGGAAASALLLAEGAWRDLHLLHAQTIGWSSIAVGLALAAGLLRRRERVRWLVLTLPVALAGVVVLGLVHR
jgi:hypothetical protein